MILYEMLYHPAAVSYKSSNFPCNNDISRKQPRSARTPGPAWRTKGPGMSCKGLNWSQAFQWEGELYMEFCQRTWPFKHVAHKQKQREKVTEKEEQSRLQLWQRKDPRRLGVFQCPCLPWITMQQASICCKVIRLAKLVQPIYRNRHLHFNNKLHGYNDLGSTNRV